MLAYLNNPNHNDLDIMEKEGEISMVFYKKFLNIKGVNDRIGDRVKELMEM